MALRPVSRSRRGCLSAAVGFRGTVGDKEEREVVLHLHTGLADATVGVSDRIDRLGAPGLGFGQEGSELGGTVGQVGPIDQAPTETRQLVAEVVQVLSSLVTTFVEGGDSLDVEAGRNARHRRPLFVIRSGNPEEVVGARRTQGLEASVAVRRQGEADARARGAHHREAGQPGARDLVSDDEGDVRPDHAHHLRVGDHPLDVLHAEGGRWDQPQ